MTITGKNRTLLEFHKILAPGLKTGGKTESGVKTLSGIPDNVVGPDNVGLNSCKVLLDMVSALTSLFGGCLFISISCMLDAAAFTSELGNVY